jgi:hypothetical protein
MNASQQSPDTNTPAISDRSDFQARGDVSLHTIRSTGLPLPQSAKSSVPTAKQDINEDIVDETDPLITRICAGIAYTIPQNASNLPIMQTTRFLIRLKTLRHTPSATEAHALSLLDNSTATIIAASKEAILYEIGMPIPYLVAEGAGVRLVHTPHWWFGKSQAEVRAGPHAEEADIRRHAAKVKELATKAGKKVWKTLKEIEIERKLEEGLRRQEEGLEMCDDVDDRWL